MSMVRGQPEELSKDNENIDKTVPQERQSVGMGSIWLLGVKIWLIVCSCCTI